MAHTSHEDILFLAPRNENIIHLLRCHIYRLSLVTFFLAPRLLRLASFLQKIVKTTNFYSQFSIYKTFEASKTAKCSPSRSHKEIIQDLSFHSPHKLAVA